MATNSGSICRVAETSSVILLAPFLISLGLPFQVASILMNLIVLLTRPCGDDGDPTAVSAVGHAQDKFTFILRRHLHKKYNGNPDMGRANDAKGDTGVQDAVLRPKGLLLPD